MKHPRLQIQQKKQTVLLENCENVREKTIEKRNLKKINYYYIK